MDLPYAHSYYRDDAVIAQALPGKTQHQGLQLFHAELLVTVQCCRCWPDKLAFVESSCRQPDTNAVVHEHLHAIGTAVGKQVGVVGVRRAEHLNHSAKRRVRARTHIQWLHCQPSAVDTNHLRTDADQQANSLAADMGQVTLMTTPPLRTSTLISGDSGSTGLVRSGNAMNDATLWLSVSTVLAQVLGPLPIRGLDWDGSLSQRCSTLAFMPCALATAAMDAPGALQAANNSALVSGEYVRLVRRTAYLGVSESLSIVSTINCCGHNVARSGVTQQGDFARRLQNYDGIP